MGAPAPIIKRAQVQAAAVASSEPSAVMPNPGAPLPARCKVQKSATIVEAGGKAIAIEITCSCGEVTLVELEVAANAPASSAVASANEDRKAQ